MTTSPPRGCSEREFAHGYTRARGGDRRALWGRSVGRRGRRALRSLCVRSLPWGSAFDEAAGGHPMEPYPCLPRPSTLCSPHARPKVPIFSLERSLRGGDLREVGRRSNVSIRCSLSSPTTM